MADDALLGGLFLGTARIHMNLCVLPVHEYCLYGLLQAFPNRGEHKTVEAIRDYPRLIERGRVDTIIKSDKVRPPSA